MSKKKMLDELAADLRAKGFYVTRNAYIEFDSQGKLIEPDWRQLSLDVALVDATRAVTEVTP